MREDIQIPTADGDARGFAFMPDDSGGPWPGVILFMDAPAIRPAMFEMGERLAKAGYYVILPDLFWRAGPYPPLDIVKAFGGDPEMGALFQRLRASTDPEKQMTDTEGCIEYLDKDPRALASRIGVTGYCMGGAIALRAAGTFPERVAAAASFHGGGLATDDPSSPHRLAPKMTAKVLVAGAEKDAHYDEAQDARLKAALAEAGVDADVSIWTGLRHGWVPSDMPVHNAEGAERHWQALEALFARALK